MPTTKVQLIDSIQNKLQFSRKKSTDLVENLLKVMKQAMGNGEDILISGFGKFCIHDKKARKGRNPATGEAMMLEARRVVTFKCSRKLRERLNAK